MRVTVPRGEQATYHFIAPAGEEFRRGHDEEDIFATYEGVRDRIRSWFENYHTESGDEEAFFTFQIPSDASLGVSEFYILTDLDGNDYLTKVELEVIEGSPELMSITSSKFSADDEVVLEGKNLGALAGTVDFNGLSGAIVEWTDARIRVIVPEGVTDGLVRVIRNDGMVSNGLQYEVISSTGDPEVVLAIPDQTIKAGNTKTIADLNTVFYDPNNDDLTYSVNISIPGLSHDVQALGEGALILVAAPDASGTAEVTVTATDADNASVNDVFLVEIEPTDVTPDLYTLSGTVTDEGGSGLEGVTLTLSGAASATTSTDASGSYTFAGLADGTYKITPSRAGYVFEPPSREVTISGGNVAGLDFTASSTSDLFYGFEGGLGDWQVTTERTATYEVSTELAHTGSYAFKAGPSSCIANCYGGNEQAVSLILDLQGVFVSEISFWALENSSRSYNFGQAGWIEINGNGEAVENSAFDPHAR